LLAGAEEAGRRLIETLRRRRHGVSRVEKARERRLGEIRVKAFVRHLGRVKPTGASSGRCAKHTLGRQGLAGWVKAQEPRLVKPALAPSGAKVYGRVKR
jgi:hypothetical protein